MMLSPELRAPSDSPTSQCGVCGADNGTHICRKGAYNLMQCGCGAIYLSPPVPDGAVDHTEDTHPASFYSLPAMMKLRWLRQSHATGRLLEVGCGDGHF